MQHSTLYLAAGEGKCGKVQVQQLTSIPLLPPGVSNFQVATVICCCNPFGGHDSTAPIVHHHRERVDRQSKMMTDLEVMMIKIFPGIHAGHFRPRKSWAASICFLGRVQGSTVRLQDFRILWTCWVRKLPFTCFLHLHSICATVWTFPIQETASTSPWPAHCVQMAWVVHIRLWNKSRT